MVEITSEESANFDLKMSIAAISIKLAAHNYTYTEKIMNDMLSELQMAQEFYDEITSEAPCDMS